jgi:hypothetical protein
MPFNVDQKGCIFDLLSAISVIKDQAQDAEIACLGVTAACFPATPRSRDPELSPEFASLRQQT